MKLVAAYRILAALSLLLVMGLPLLTAVTPNTPTTHTTSGATPDTPQASCAASERYGILLTICVPTPVVHIGEPENITLTMTNTGTNISAVVYNMASVEIVRDSTTVFYSSQNCLILENCLVQLGETISFSFAWTPGAPGPYSLQGALAWSFSCILVQPACLAPSAIDQVELQVFVAASEGSHGPIHAI